MSMDWLYSDLWRAHVSWVTPAWVGGTEEGRKDFDAKRWLDQIELARYKTLIFYVKFVDGSLTFPSKYSKTKPERDFFGECVTEAHKRGMRVLAYYPSALDQVTGRQHPDWQVKRRDGKPPVFWATRWPDAYCCINNPEYRNLVLGQLAELRDNYNPDGFWLDVFEPYTGDINPLSWYPINEENCFCQSCQAKYQAETNGSNLFSTSDTLWYQSCYVDFLGEINKLIKKNNPDCVLGQNTGNRIPGFDKIDDFFTHEACTAPTISLYCRSMRPLGKPFETTSRLYTEVHSWAIRSPDRVLLESLATVVHGGASCMELSPMPTGKIMDDAIIRVAAAGRYIRKIESYLLDTKPVYDAGIFQPEWRYGCPFAPPPPGGWTSVLMERDIPFALLYANADLSPYQLLILDGSVIPDKKLTIKLADYVNKGGNLIMECTPAEHGLTAAFETPAGDILSEVLGIKNQGKTGYSAHYLSGLDSRIAGEMGEDELIVEGEADKIELITAKALAYYRYEIIDRKLIKDFYLNLPPKMKKSDDPVITINRYGKGRAMYIACPLTIVEIRNHRNNGADAREYPTQLAANLARFMIGEPLLRGTTPAGVEVVVNVQEGRHVVHLLNNYVSGQYYDNRKSILKLADVPVAINERRSGEIKRAFRLKGGKKEATSIRRDGQWAEVRIPELGVHELIVLEH